MVTHSSIVAWRTSMDGEAWLATVHGVAESERTEQLSTDIPVVRTPSLPSCSLPRRCRYTVVSQLSQQALILVSRDYKLVKQKH